MDISNMKNMIVLKNLPSNLVEEAIVVLKANRKIKKPEYIESKQDNFKNNKNDKQNNNEDYIIKEAELVISNYIMAVEEQDVRGKKELKIMQEKYKKLKICTIAISTVMAISFFMNLI